MRCGLHIHAASLLGGIGNTPLLNAFFRSMLQLCKPCRCVRDRSGIAREYEAAMEIKHESAAYKDKAQAVRIPRAERLRL
jgi:hypothetical protein